MVVGTVNVRTKRMWTSTEKNALSIFQNAVDLHGGNLIFDCPNRIYAVGMNGLAFAYINSSKPYVENFTYANEIRISTLNYSSFTNPYQTKNTRKCGLRSAKNPPVPMC